ncbi:MAG: histidine phosphatase family protein [Pseudomonadota bacterium]
MKTLIVMRHAKSSWSDPGAQDLDRPLNDRGIKAAQAIGEWLSFGGFIPDLVLCSNARRTAQTWRSLGLEAELRFRAPLYHAPAETILAEARGAEGDCVLILGHNPGIADFASLILSTPPRHARFGDYPTGATLVAQFDGDWPELGAGKANARAFTVPSDVME